MLERTAYKEILKGESLFHYGYTIRLAMTVNKVTEVVELTEVKIDQAILSPNGGFFKWQIIK